MTPPHAPIPLDPKDGGALNWLDMVDEEHRVLLEFMGPPYPKTPAAQEAWLIDQLRGDLHQVFFFTPLAHKGMNLDFRPAEERSLARPGLFLTRGSVPLAQLFSLPNVDPQSELAAFRKFLEWVDERCQEHAHEGREPTIQWFRAGHNRRGLEWARMKDEAARKRLNEELEAWRERPWFEEWYRVNMGGFSKVRMGPHCWLAMASLVPDRLWARLMGQRRGLAGRKGP